MNKKVEDWCWCAKKDPLSCRFYALESMPFELGPTEIIVCKNHGMFSKKWWQKKYRHHDEGKYRGGAGPMPTY